MITHRPCAVPPWQVVQFFCSKGYFKSPNCLREVQATIKKGKRITLMADPEKGGAPLEVIKNEECPTDLRRLIFDVARPCESATPRGGRNVILFFRKANLQAAISPRGR